jgi:hypothetical protein
MIINIATIIKAMIATNANDFETILYILILGLLFSQ